jgi:hypothetical protein
MLSRTLSSLVLIVCLIVHAAQPGPVLNPNCPPNELCCPTSVWWNADMLPGVYEGYNMSGTIEFSGGQELPLVSIEASPYQWEQSNGYRLQCHYKKGNSAIYASSMGMFQEFKGKWTYLFKKPTLKCTGNQSDDCTGAGVK